MAFPTRSAQGLHCCCCCFIQFSLLLSLTQLPISMYIPSSARLYGGSSGLTLALHSSGCGWVSHLCRRPGGTGFSLFLHCPFWTSLFLLPHAPSCGWWRVELHSVEQPEQKLWLKPNHTHPRWVPNTSQYTTDDPLNVVWIVKWLNDLLISLQEIMKWK